MARQVVLDTNAFIYSFEFPKSNSAKIISLLNAGKIEAVITQQVLNEVVRYFRNFHNKQLADEFRHYILEVCIVIQINDMAAEIEQNKGKINQKDLPQIAAAKHLQIKIASYDKDFEKFAEYLTPQQFIKSLGITASSSKF